MTKPSPSSLMDELFSSTRYVGHVKPWSVLPETGMAEDEPDAPYNAEKEAERLYAQEWDESKHPRDKDGKFQGVTVYHGTSESYLASIRKKGLLVNPGKRNWKAKDNEEFYEGERGEAVYVSPNWNGAISWAEMAARKAKASAIVLKIEVPAKAAGLLKRDRVAGGGAKYLPKNVPASWIKGYKIFDPKADAFGELHKFAVGDDTSDVVYLAVICSDTAEYAYNPDQERDERGRWTDGGDGPDPVVLVQDGVGEEAARKFKAAIANTSTKLISAIKASRPGAEDPPITVQLVKRIEQDPDFYKGTEIVVDGIYEPGDRKIRIAETHLADATQKDYEIVVAHEMMHALDHADRSLDKYGYGASSLISTEWAQDRRALSENQKKTFSYYHDFKREAFAQIGAYLVTGHSRSTSETRSGLFAAFPKTTAAVKELLQKRGVL